MDEKQIQYRDELRNIRRELGLSQTKMAELLGVQLWSYSRWERDNQQRKISEPMIRLARLLLAEHKKSTTP